MKKAMLIIIILFMALWIFAGENEDIVNALKLQKLSQHLKLNETQIAKYIKMEEKIKQINKHYMDEGRKIIDNLKNDIENNNYKNANKIFNKINDLEIKKINEINNVRKNFLNTLSDEQKAKMILFEFEFRRKLREFLIKKDINKKMIK